MPLAITVCAGTLCALGTYVHAATPHATGTEDVVSLECARCDIKTTDISSVFPLLVILRAPRARLAQAPLVCDRADLSLGMGPLICKTLTTISTLRA